MNVEALPYTLLLILAELTIGSLWITLASDLRGGVTRGFVMTMMLCVAVAAWLTYWTASGVAPGEDVDGYSVDRGWFTPANRAMLVVIVTSAMYMFSAFMGWDAVGRLNGIAGAGAGIFAVVAYAGLLAPPAWGYPATLLALLAGTFAMGAVSVSMVWGHWYLTEGALPAWPLRDLSWVLVGAVAFQSIVVVLNLAIPERETPSSANAISTGIYGNPVFYLRVAVGLCFPAVLGVLALRTTALRAMQSATGLLYIAMAAVFAGEVLGKGLMFMTGKPI